MARGTTLSLSLSLSLSVDGWVCCYPQVEPHKASPLIPVVVGQLPGLTYYYSTSTAMILWLSRLAASSTHFRLSCPPPPCCRPPPSHTSAGLFGWNILGIKQYLYRTQSVGLLEKLVSFSAFWELCTVKAPLCVIISVVDHWREMWWHWYPQYL